MSKNKASIKMPQRSPLLCMLMQRLEAKKAIEGSVTLKPHNAVQYDI